MDDRAHVSAVTERRGERQHLEQWMRWSSLVVSAAAVLAMLFGLGDIVVTGSIARLTEAPALAVPALLHPTRDTLGLFATSLGIVLLSLLPALRVLLATLLYAGRRAWIDAAVALVVFVELVLSMSTGRG
jgi:hypothetical protein